MGRPRKITDDKILAAAERVVVRLGASGLSIDAVAQEAGVSKSRVVYDHKSKSALLEAMIDRQMSLEMDRVSAAVAEHANCVHPQLFGRIAVAERVPDDTDRAVALAVSASASGEEAFQQKMRQWSEWDLEAIADGPRPDAALMSYLALTGLSCIELFGLPDWDPAERTRVLEGIRIIYASFPDPMEA